MDSRSGGLLNQNGPSTEIAENSSNLANPIVPPPNETGGEQKMSRRDFNMGGIGGGRANLGKLTQYDSNDHGRNSKNLLIMYGDHA